LPAPSTQATVVAANDMRKGRIKKCSSFNR
jgi:hypothetical protein